ncbi:MAG: glycosyltransferase family 1 protein [Ktedonobacteraceae bacterium]
MKIGFNALPLQTPANGSGQYLLHLLHALAEIDTQNKYVLLGENFVLRDSKGRLKGSSLPISFPYQMHPTLAFSLHSENIQKVLWEQFTGPRAARANEVDLFHVPYFAPPFAPRIPTIVTIHDAIPLRLPLYRSGARVEAYMRLVASAAHKATMIITVSQHAKEDIMDALHLPAERIRVIYEAAGDEYVPITDTAILAAARARYGIGEQYIFYLGGLDSRKNVLQLVRAFAQLYRQLGNPQLQLFISGNPAKQKGPFFPDPRPVAAELGISDQIIYRFVEEADKAALYSGASLFVYPSMYEGFGLPPLEAMSCGAPVVCSNRTSLPEVVGDAALCVDPDDTQALAEAMLSVLTDTTLRDDLRVRSIQRAAQFSWRKTATETLSVYEEALTRSKK